MIFIVCFSLGGQDVDVGLTHTSSISLNQFSQHNKLRLEIQPFVPNNHPESDRSSSDTMYSAGISSTEVTGQRNQPDRNNSSDGSIESDLNKSNDSLRLEKDVGKVLYVAAEDKTKTSTDSKDAFTQIESAESPMETGANIEECQQHSQSPNKASGNVSNEKNVASSSAQSHKDNSSDVEENEVNEQDARLVYSIPDVESDNLPTASVANRSFFLTDAKMSKKFGTVIIQLNENGLQLMGLDVTPDAFDRENGGLECCNCKCANLEDMPPHPADEELVQNLESAQLLIQETLAKMDLKKDSNNRRDSGAASSSRSRSLNRPGRVESCDNREHSMVSAVSSKRQTDLDEQEVNDFGDEARVSLENPVSVCNRNPREVSEINYPKEGSRRETNMMGKNATLSQGNFTMPSYHNYQSIPSLPSSGSVQNGRKSEKGLEKEKENSFRNPNQSKVAANEISKDDCIDIEVEHCIEEGTDEEGNLEPTVKVLGMESKNKRETSAAAAVKSATKESFESRKEESINPTQKQHMLHLEAIAKGREQRPEDPNGKKVAQKRSTSPKAVGVVANLNILERSPRSQSSASLGTGKAANGKEHPPKDVSPISTLSPPFEKSVSSRKKKTPVKNNRSGWDLNKNSSVSNGGIPMAIPPYIDTVLANSHKSSSADSPSGLPSSSSRLAPTLHQQSKLIFSMDSLKRDASGKSGALMFHPITKPELSDKPRAGLNSICNGDVQKKASATVTSINGPSPTENEPNLNSYSSGKTLSPTKKTLKRPLAPLGESKVDNDVRADKIARSSVPSPPKVKLNSMNLEITLKPLYFPENQTSMEYSEWVLKQAEFEKHLLETNVGEQKRVIVRGGSSSPSDASFVSPGTVSLIESDASFYSCNQEPSLTESKATTAATNASTLDSGRYKNSERLHQDGTHERSGFVVTGNLEKHLGRNAGSRNTELAYYYTGGNRRGDALVHIKPKPGRR